MFRQVVRQMHGKAANTIVLSKDEKCFVAYHPRQEHPYEYTRPLPKEEKQEESILRVNSRNMITEQPNLEQIQNITYTHKSYWKVSRSVELRKKYKEAFDDREDRKGLTS